MTREEAVSIHDSGQWATWSDVEVVRRQLFEERTILPFSRFKSALEGVLNHSVHTYQLGDEDAVALMKSEFLALHPNP